MQSVAEFIMRSRFHSLLVAIPAAASGLFFWLSAAVIALVTLRKGVSAGAAVLAFVMLPAAAIAYVADPIVLICILLAFVMAAVLRLTMKWRSSLLAGVALALFTAVLLNWVFDGYLTDIIDRGRQQLQAIAANWEQTQRTEEAKFLSGLLDNAGNETALPFVSGFLSIMSLGLAALMVVLARHWQAMLYNPGGFGEEFRELRMTAPIVCVLLAVTMLFASMPGFKVWALMALMPLFFAGIALVHHIAFEGKWSKSWMILFYASLILIWPVKSLACAFGAADGFLNFRARYAGRAQ